MGEKEMVNDAIKRCGKAVVVFFFSTWALQGLIYWYLTSGYSSGFLRSYFYSHEGDTELRVLYFNLMFCITSLTLSLAMLIIYCKYAISQSLQDTASEPLLAS